MQHFNELLRRAVLNLLGMVLHSCSSLKSCCVVQLSEGEANQQAEHC